MPFGLIQVLIMFLTGTCEFIFPHLPNFYWLSAGFSFSTSFLVDFFP